MKWNGFHLDWAYINPKCGRAYDRARDPCISCFVLKLYLPRCHGHLKKPFAAFQKKINVSCNIRENIISTFNMIINDSWAYIFPWVQRSDWVLFINECIFKLKLDLKILCLYLVTKIIHLTFQAPSSSQSYSTKQSVFSYIRNDHLALKQTLLSRPAVHISRDWRGWLLSLLSPPALLHRCAVLRSRMREP